MIIILLLLKKNKEKKVVVIIDGISTFFMYKYSFATNGVSNYKEDIIGKILLHQ